MAADKGMTMQEDGKNYGDFLLETIEDAKDQFTEEELKVLREGVGDEDPAIWRIKLTKLEEKFPELMPEIPGRNRQRPCGNDTASPSRQQHATPSPPLRARIWMGIR